jgi:hypothetical protein
MKYLAILIFLIVIGCNQCKLPTKYDIHYSNNADFNIHYYPAYGYGNNKIYPDTTIFFSKEELGFIRKKMYVIEAENIPVEAIVKDISSDTLSIFFFHTDTVQKYSWEEIQQNYNILKRYDLSSDDFQRLLDRNGVPVITYPPTEAMKDMKMYPPYSK